MEKPAIPPPPGHVSDFNKKVGLAPVFYAVSGILLFLMVVAMALRTWAKVLIIRLFQWVDITIVLGFLGAIFYYIVVILCFTFAGFGKHYWDVPASLVGSRTFLILAYCADAWLTPVIYFIRLSFMLLYLDIFKPFRWARLTCWINIGLMTCFYIPVFIVQLYDSTPKHGETWQEDFADPLFAASEKLAIPLSSVSLAFDLLVFIFPLVAVSQLQMSRTRKVEVSLVFSTALIAIIASVLSLAYRIKAGTSPDITYTTFPVQFIGLVEIQVGVIVFCMPTMSSLYHYYFRRQYSDMAAAATRRSPLPGGNANSSSHLAAKGRLTDAVTLTDGYDSNTSHNFDHGPKFERELGLELSKFPTGSNRT